MRIAILGSSSFLVRSALSEWCGQGHEVTLFSRKEPAALPTGTRWLSFALPDQPVQAEALAGYDAIIYAVAAGVQSGSGATADELYFANAVYPLRLLAELARASFVGKWISFGSYFEIGDAPQPCAFDEPAFLGALFRVPNAYCDAKRFLSRGLAFGHWPVRVHHFVLPTIYGYGEERARVIPYVVDCLQRGVVPALSAGMQKRQYLHVSDAARLVGRAINESLPTGVLHAAPVGALSVGDIVRTVFRCLGRTDEPVFGTVNTRDETMRHLELDGRALLALIGWSPTVSLEEGIVSYISAKP